MLYFYIILGMTWLSSYYAFLIYNAKTMTVEMLGRDKLEFERFYKSMPVRIISFI